MRRAQSDQLGAGDLLTERVADMRSCSSCRSAPAQPGAGALPLRRGVIIRFSTARSVSGRSPPCGFAPLRLFVHLPVVSLSRGCRRHAPSQAEFAARGGLRYPSRSQKSARHSARKGR